MQELMDEAKCYACYGLTQAQMLALALTRRWLLSVSPSADTSPQSLITYANCYACQGSLSIFELLLLAMLDQIAQA